MKEEAAPFVMAEEVYDVMPKDRKHALRYIVTDAEASWIVGVSKEETEEEPEYKTKQGDKLIEPEIVAIVVLCEKCLGVFCRRQGLDINNLSLEFEELRKTTQAALDFFQKESIQGPLNNTKNEH